MPAPSPLTVNEMMTALYSELKPLAFVPNYLKKEALEPIRPYFDLVRTGELYSHMILPKGEIKTSEIRETLSRVVHWPVREIILVSNMGNERPWGGTRSTDLWLDPLYDALSPALDRWARVYRRGISIRQGEALHRLLNQALDRAIRDELGSNLRATFTDGLEDQISWALSASLKLYVFGVLTGVVELKENYRALLDLQTRCAPLGMDKTASGRWYVFVR